MTKTINNPKPNFVDYSIYRGAHIQIEKSENNYTAHIAQKLGPFISLEDANTTAMKLVDNNIKAASK